jgi:hypothetical protein
MSQKDIPVTQLSNKNYKLTVSVDMFLLNTRLTVLNTLCDEEIVKKNKYTKESTEIARRPGTMLSRSLSLCKITMFIFFRDGDLPTINEEILYHTSQRDEP